MNQLTGRRHMLPALLLGLLPGLLWLTTARAADIDMFVGEVRVLETGPVERVAVGNGSLMSTSIVENGGQLLLLAEKPGRTDLHIWYEDGREEQMSLEISETDVSAELVAVRSLLRDQPGLSARRLGNRIVIEGEMEPESGPVVDAIAGTFDNIINIASPAKVGDQKMVYMSVRVTEFSTSRLKELGISWDQRFNGPSAGFASEFQNGNEISALNTSPLDPLNATDASSAFGYFGIATQVNSMINLAVSNGDALILAEPTLSARSGGEAEFLSGGEIPLETTSVDGQTNVEFREFGTRLIIRPVADENGRVVADVEVEISSVDRDLAVGNIPGFRSRKTNTSVVLSDSETLVISGLTDTQMSENVEKIAGLGDLPIIGALFRSTTFDNSKSELVIFVTPRIVDASSEFNRRKVERADELREKFLKATDREDLILD